MTEAERRRFERLMRLRRDYRQLVDERERMRDLLLQAVEVIERLAEQQAMEDNWWRPEADRFRAEAIGGAASRASRFSESGDTSVLLEGPSGKDTARERIAQLEAKLYDSRPGEELTDAEFYGR